SWCKIEYNGRVGYVAKAGASGRQYMWTLPLVMHDLSFYDFPYSDQVLTDGGYLNLRLEPKINAPILNRITKGETVSVLDVASSPTFMTINEKLIFGCWVLVEYQSQQGYCFSWYLEDTRIPSIDPFSELD
ncbi:MAG: SH3 domain-containing protein, partial [Cyanobacteria bacterium J06649_11]